MNERIRELALQATSIQGPTPYNPLTFEVFNKEKFAELIVLECLDITRWKDYEMSNEQRIRLEVYQDIKKHFGIKD